MKFFKVERRKQYADVTRISNEHDDLFAITCLQIKFLFPFEINTKSVQFHSIQFSSIQLNYGNPFFFILLSCSNTL